MKGTYTLLIELNKPVDIPIGKLGNYHFEAGYYAYIGSALNNLEKRVERHSNAEKKLHWHTDYLLNHAKVQQVIYGETDKKLECSIAKELIKTLEPIPGFGCSDRCT